MSDAALERALKRRPAGWVPPGPEPAGACGRAELLPTEDEDLSFLTGNYRIFQRRRGHRWSLDDFITALCAIRAGRSFGAPAEYADLGCGIGSVLMMVAWAFPSARALGIEAQELSVGLARRSLAYNGLEPRAAVVHGDLRETALTLEAGRFDLVTGTPPYIALGHGLVSDKEQRGPCCFETRGGVEDYCLAAAHLLRQDGLFVVCAGAVPDSEGRGEAAAAAAGLAVLERVDVVPRAGKAVLFRVFVMKKAAAAEPPRLARFVVRDEAAAVTEQMRAARIEMGLPPLP